MRLRLGNDQVLENPTADHVSGALHALPGGDSSYAILIRDDERFMQCAGWWKDGFVLEYQDGSLESHFQCSDSELPLADVIDAFQSYLAGGDHWRTVFSWNKIQI